jgi:hypothetical protein
MWCRLGAPVLIKGMTEYEVVRRNASADVEIRLVSGVYEVFAGDDLVVRTGVQASAQAEYEEAVYARSEKQRAKLAAERANDAYRALAQENGAQRATRASRGGKGGRGGV